MAEAAVRDDQRHGGGGGGGIAVVVVEDDSVAAAGRRPSRNDDDGGGGGNNGSRWEIEEVEPAGAPSAPAAGASIVPPGDAAEDVYVAVGKGGSSLAALSWALRRLTKPRSFVYLVHVFPVVTSIPTPLGMMRKGQATPEEVETYMNQERSKRREMLQKFLDHCRNFQVIVDVYLIESNQIADAIIELIPVLTIKQLVLGVSKSNVRKLKKGSTIAGQVQKSAPLYCDVKIICDGKEVPAVKTADPTPPFSPSPVNHNSISHIPTPPFSPSPINYNSRSHMQTPPSATPNRDDIAANDDKDNTNPKERKKIPKFFRCLSFS